MVEILFCAGVPLGFFILLVAVVWLRQPHQTLHRGPLLVAGAILLLGLIGTALYADAVRQSTLEEARTRFQREAEQLEEDLQTQMEDLRHLLNGLRGLFLASQQVSRTEVQKYLGARDLQLEYPGIRGLGFIERVAGGSQPDRYVIKYLEPQGPNSSAIGYDIGSESRRRTSAELSMRSGAAALTPRIQLLQDPLGRPGFVLLLPTYANGIPVTEAERVRSLRGWVFAPVVFSELIAGGKGLDSALINFQVFDKPDLNASSLVYDSELPDGDLQSKESLERGTHSRFSLVRPILLIDQVFYLRTNSEAAFEASYHPREHLKAAVLGSGLSALLATVMWLLMVGRARAQDLARSMTRDLERLAMVAERTNNAVYFADTAWRITWVNEGFTRMCGFSSEEAIGLRPSQLLHSPLADPQTAQKIDSKAEYGQRVQIQVLQRHKSGRDYWVDLEVIPVMDAQGRITSYMSVQSDITQEVAAKAAMLLEKERAENILIGTNVGTWELNLLTGEERWNDRWSAMMGFAREDVGSGGIEAFWHQRLAPGETERLRAAMAECIAGRQDSYACDVRVQRKDGSWMWILSRAKVMSRNAIGEPEWIGGIHTDVTESKQVELSLREMETFLDRAGRIASVGAWQIDLQTRAITFSAQTCAIHGMAPGFAPSEEVALSFYPPADRERLSEAMRSATQEGTPWDMVVEFNNVQGEQRWVRIYGEVGYDGDKPVRLIGAFQDVTRDRLSQLEVEHSGALLRGAIEAINEAFVLFDPQDRLVFCNDKYRATFFRSSDLLVYGASFESVLRGGAERGEYVDALGRVDEWVQERMMARRAGNVSMEQRLHDGRWLKVIERRMPDGHMVGFRIDITELKLATAAAELTSATRGEEQRRMQNILEGTHVGTWEWNLQTGVSIYNDQYVGMLGYTLEELEPLGYDTWARLVHPDDLVASAQLMQQHLTGERVNYEIEVRMQHKAGYWIWVLAKGKLAQRLDDGRPLWVYGTHMDITERKRAEQQLAQTTATLQNVLDSATAVGVMTMGLDFRLRMFNRGAENLLGYRAEELLDRMSASIFFDLSELGALGETMELMLGHMPNQHELLTHVVQKREEQEWSLVRRDGTRFKANLIFSPMRDAQGVLEGHLAVLYDISKQKEYESSLREAMHLAEQSSVAKSQFLANMSHEIRTPMNAILGMLQLLRNTPLTPHQNDYAEKAVGAAQSLLGLLNDILDFSKVEAGKMQLHPEPFVLDELLDDLSVILSSNLGTRDVDLVFDVDPQIPRELIADALRLKQVLINLGGNAVKFTERGNVTIRWTLVTRTPERVRVNVAVVDTGIGIAPENQSRIFDAFTQAESNTTRRFGGTGLGLVICTRLIRLMGGELQLSSTLGKGSSFSFTLDLKPAYLDQEQTVAAGPALRALLVDDNTTARKAAATMMQSLGWTVEVAASGAEALQLLETAMADAARAPDALFVDAEMPQMDGWEVLSQVRQRYAEKNLPKLILLSRQSRGALAQRGDHLQEPLDGLLVRPLTAPMFAKAVEQARQGSAALTKPRSTGGGSLTGMRVLLVEDNRINQQVAQELLGAEGALVTLADNGELGLKALFDAVPVFDVVLMDLQMPVMDGLSATRLLRADPRFATLPVIAMTANVMRSDREDCLAAGMNDHVGKPFDLKQLVHTLRAHTGWSTRAAGPAAPVQLLATPPASAAVDVEQALARMGGNQALLQRSIAAFVTDAKLLPQRLEQRLQQGDWTQAKRELHGFKGLSATVGALALATLAARAEQRVKDLHESSKQGIDQHEVLAQLSTQLAQQVNQYLPELEAVAKRLEVARQDAVVNQATTLLEVLGEGELEQLRSLLIALQSSNMVSLELHARLRQQMGDGLAESLAAKLEPLNAAMADLSFDTAAVECEKLLRTATEK